MVASGLPISNGNKHTDEIAMMALHFMSAIKFFKIQHMPKESLALRIGIHSGKERNQHHIYISHKSLYVYHWVLQQDLNLGSLESLF